MTPPDASSELLRLGVMATSRKADERRLPIHPAHVERIDADLRARMFLERGYGARFGVADPELAPVRGDFCTNCGAKQLGGNKFCGSCGHRVG